MQGNDSAGRSYSISHKKLSSQQSEARRKRGGSMDNLIDSIETSETGLVLDTSNFQFHSSRENDEDLSRHQEEVFLN